MRPVDYFEILVKDIHMTVMSTTDEQGLPYTAAMDMMDYDENGVYFLTSRGKNIYKRIKNRGFVALTGIKGTDTMDSVAVSIRGKVRELGNAAAKALFDKNPYMYEIFPTEKSRAAISVFCIYSGNGEYFTIKGKEITKIDFTFGDGEEVPESYVVGENCISCGKCAEYCPRDCLVPGKPFVIIDDKCIRCGNCLDVCPVGAVKLCPPTPPH